MAESEEQVQTEQKDVDDDESEETNYKPPAEKSLNEILSTDKGDESLEKYKKALLGQAAEASDLVFFKDDSRKVIVTKLGLISEGRDEKSIDLTGDLHKLKEQVFTIKEGCKYRLKIYFYVQREIVSGLRYFQKTSRKGIQVDKTNYMVGSYAPKAELQCYQTPPDEAPQGMIARGSYKVHSLFTDDDKTKHLEWEWKFDIKKEWD